MKKELCLFSAPNKFIDKKLFKLKKFNFRFNEIWKKKDLKKNVKITGWIVNTGQSFKINTEILSYFPNLRILITPSTGTNHIDLNCCKKKKIKVFSLLDDRKNLNQIRASSEFTFLLILNSLRRLDKAINEVDNNRWRQNENLMRGDELYGKSVGIVGLGRIGSNLSRWLKMFGAKVTYCDIKKKTTQIKKKSIDHIFLNSSIISICCSLNKYTHNLINLSKLKLLKKNAILINTSRGEVINEKDLIYFLRKRKDIFFSTDVLSGEINGTNLRSKLVNLHKKRRVIITPHIAGASKESQTKAAQISLNLLKKNFK